MTADPTEHEPALTGQRMIERSDFDLQLAPSVVLVYDQSLLPARSSKRRHKNSRHPFRTVGSLDSKVDIVVAAGPGAPVAAVTVEFLAALGVDRIITVGVAGSLHGTVDDPVRVVERAESDEGVSEHYGAHLSSDTALTASLIDALRCSSAVTLTTDVPFRHTQPRLARHRARADLVEMECAALFASAHYSGARAASVLVVSDEFHGNDWRMGDPAKTRPGLDRALAAATAVLRSNA